MGGGACADIDSMTSTTHHGDVLAPARLRRVLASPRWRSRTALAQGLAPLAALGVLVLLLRGDGLSWLAGMTAGASTTAWLIARRTPRVALTSAPIDHGDGDTREQLSLLGNAGWSAVHDLDAHYGRYRHVAIGPGGVILLQSQRLAHPWRPHDPDSERELLILRRRALAGAANLRRELEDATRQPAWVQPVVVVWSEFPAGCVQDGRCVFVSGPGLVDWLRRRPGQLLPERADALRAALESLGAGAAPAASVAA
jgi:hypothetical protein